MAGPAPVAKCHRECMAAICSAVCGLAPHADPSQVVQLDQAIAICLEVLRKELMADNEIAAMVAASLDRK